MQDSARPLGDAPVDWVQVLRNKVGAMTVNADLLLDLTEGPARERAQALLRSAEAAGWALDALDMAIRPTTARALGPGQAGLEIVGRTSSNEARAHRSRCGSDM